ncbi:MAG: FAD-dependent oxidoreductase, partial [Halobacteria archaeon]|nr:FAD-dependent oxidoreductase [Halobacteria archaeon]
MTDFDLIVIGGGTGNKVASAAADDDTSVALIEPGRIGGTCLNRGCNPSKMVIQRADVVNTIREAGKFGIDASVEGFDFGAITGEINDTLAAISDRMERQKMEDDNLTLIKEKAKFVDERTVEVGGETLTGEKIVVAAGSRPVVPGVIDGIEDVDYITSTEALRLDEQPDELVVIGGGYIAVELGYFYESMGTDVSIVEMEPNLIPREDPDVSELFTRIARERHDVYTE